MPSKGGGQNFSAHYAQFSPYFLCGGFGAFDSYRGQNFVLFCQRGDQNFFQVHKGGAVFLLSSKGGPEKIDDSPSQIDTPSP